MCRGTYLVEHDLRVWQHGGDDIQVRPKHVGADGGDRRPLPRRQILGQQRRGRGLRAVLAQRDHLPMDDVREHRPEPIALPPVDLIEADVPRLSFRPRPIPLGEKGFLRATGFPPAPAMPHRGMARRHRLTVHTNLLPQPTRDARLRVRELNPLRPNPAATTHHPSLPIDQRHRMGRPRQIIPGPRLRRPHAPCPPATAAARVAPPVAFHQHAHSAGCRIILALDPLDPKSRQAQNPRTIALRSHASSLVVCTSREDDTGWSGAK
jgi:hypothetical protein